MGAAGALTAPVAHAAKFSIDDTKWISVGAGLRTSFNAFQNAAPDGKSYSKDFELDSIRLYLNGQIHKYIKFTFNTERQSEDNIRVLDGIAQFEFSDLVNVWAGRFLPPSDRSNLSGPYYLNTWNFPFVQNYPAIFAGRDDGAAFWGQIGGGQFKYQAGAFKGRKGGPNQSDNLLYAGRLTYNFWDPEPGYYNSSTYYGAKDILAIGLVGQFQKDGAGTEAAPGDFRGWNVDALMEKKLPGVGVVTLEGAYYSYNTDDKPDAVLIQGHGYFGLASYLFPEKIGIGQLQPNVRYERLDRDTGGAHKRWDVGLNYVIDGHNARVSLIYGREDPGPGLNSFNSFQLGVQLQI